MLRVNLSNGSIIELSATLEHRIRHEADRVVKDDQESIELDDLLEALCDRVVGQQILESAMARGHVELSADSTPKRQPGLTHEPSEADIEARARRAHGG